MNQPLLYVCPMHRDVHATEAGSCPHCGIALVPEGAPFALLRHVIGNPLHLAMMVALMLAAMAAAMMIV